MLYPSWLTKEINEQVWGFIHPHAVQLRGAQLGCQALPDRDRQVLCSWNPGREFRHFLVEKTMVHGVKDFAVQNFLQLLQVHDEAGAWVHLALDRDLKRVVMAVAVGIIAFAENAAILFRSEVRVVVIVRSGEFDFASEIYHLFCFLMSSFARLGGRGRPSLTGSC